MNGVDEQTVFSPCRLWRYTLWRTWDVDSVTGTGDDLAHAEGYVQIIGLNPSVADETKDDPTIRRCIQFAKDWGYGGLCMTNIFAWRDTDPKGMKKVRDPIGKDNDHWLITIAKPADIVVAAWGTHGSHLYRGYKVKRMFADAGIKLHCLNTTAGGHPSHPLYQRANAVPIPYV